MDISDLTLRQLQKETSRALEVMVATNNNLSKFNKMADHDSQKWYISIIKWYISEYGDLPSCAGPGKKVKLIDE